MDEDDGEEGNEVSVAWRRRRSELAPPSPWMYKQTGTNGPLEWVCLIYGFTLSDLILAS